MLIGIKIGPFIFVFIHIVTDEWMNRRTSSEHYASACIEIHAQTSITKLNKYAVKICCS